MTADLDKANALNAHSGLNALATELPTTIPEVEAAREKAKQDYRDLERRLFDHGTALAIAIAGEPFCKSCGNWAELKGQNRMPRQVFQGGKWMKAIATEAVPLCLRCAGLRVGVRVEVTNYKRDELPAGTIIDADNEAWLIDCDDGERRRSLSAHLRILGGDN